MEEHKLFVVEAVNRLLRSLLKPVLPLAPEGYVIPPHILMAVLAALFLAGILKFGGRKRELYPGRIQLVFEKIVDFFQNMVFDFLGPEGKRYVPVIGTLGLFIFTANMMGLFPDLASPTANLNVTVGCAVFIFIYYHIQGIRKHGLFRYLRQFTGPVWYLAIIFVPIEVISHLSRILSLSLRLFVNIFGEDLVIISIITIFAYVTPVPMMAFAIFTSVLQAYIFVTLSLIYLSGALATEH